MYNVYNTNKSISYTMNTSQKSEVIEALQKLLEDFKQAPSEAPERSYSLDVHLRVNTRSEETGSKYISKGDYGIALNEANTIPCEQARWVSSQS